MYKFIKIEINMYILYNVIINNRYKTLRISVVNNYDEMKQYENEKKILNRLLQTESCKYDFALLAYLKYLHILFLTLKVYYYTFIKKYKLIFDFLIILLKWRLYSSSMTNKLISILLFSTRNHHISYE